jgi:hypothetical protein
LALLPLFHLNQGHALNVHQGLSSQHGREDHPCFNSHTGFVSSPDLALFKGPGGTLFVTFIPVQRLARPRRLRLNEPPPASKGERNLCQRCWRVKRFLPATASFTEFFPAGKTRLMA